MSALLHISHLSAQAFDAHTELRALGRLAEAGMTLAPLRLLSGATEEQFYRLNNLPKQLTALFADLDLSQPDEDDIEERSPQAQRLIRAHYLLDEVVDTFYAGLEGLPQELRVRRLNEPGFYSGGRAVLRGRPALLALKDLWADDWAYEALWERVAKEASVALSARPLLIAAPGYEDAGDGEAARASDLLGQAVRLLHDPDFGLTGVRFISP